MALISKTRCSGSRCSHKAVYKGGHCDNPVCPNNIVDCTVPSHWEMLPSADDGTGPDTE